MTNNVITIDGIPINITIPEKGIKRNFEIVDTDKAGRLINGDMQRDIVGTYYNYTVEFKTNNLTLNEYDEFYEIISAPVDFHTIVIPFGQGSLTFKAYITNGEDVLNKIDSNGNRWSGITINFIAMSPARR